MHLRFRKTEWGQNRFWLFHFEHFEGLMCRFWVILHWKYAQGWLTLRERFTPFVNFVLTIACSSGILLIIMWPRMVCFPRRGRIEFPQWIKHFWASVNIWSKIWAARKLNIQKLFQPLTPFRLHALHFQLLCYVLSSDNFAPMERIVFLSDTVQRVN